jgi:hypothetical protein
VLVARAPRVHLAVVAIPVLVVAGWYGKQYAQFGSFSASSWIGMNMARTVFYELDPDDLQRDVDDGKISRLALLGGFRNPGVYGYVRDGRRGIAVLDRRSTSLGQPNFNFEPYTDISSELLDDSLTAIRLHPRHYLRNVGLATRFYFLPASDYPYLTENRSNMVTFEQRFAQVTQLQWRPYNPFIPRPWKGHGGTAPGVATVSWGIVAVYLLSMGGLVLVAVSPLRRRAGLRRPEALGVAVIAFTIVYASAVGTLLELGENNRFRFETDAIAYAGAVAVSAGIVRIVRDRRARVAR